MSDLKQFLDWSGLKHYDSKIKDYIGDRTCSIGEDGYWYIGGEKTKYMAAGQDGKDGVDGAPGQDGKDGVDGAPGQDGKDGQDGLTPFIGDNGNWWIGNEDTGVQAEGKDGDELNLQLGEEITTNVVCGALGIGQTLEANLTLADIVKKLTTKVYEPSKESAPKATLTMTNQDAVVEVGTTITPTLTPKFTDGTFKTYGEGATTTTNMNAGCSVTSYTISRGETQVASGTNTLEAFTDSYPISEETVTYKTTIAYGASTKYPQDSNGDEDTTIIWDGSSVSANSTSVIGKYQYYAGCSDVDPTADEIRAALNDTENWIDPSKTVDIVNTNTKMIFAIPASYSLVSAVSSQFENQTGNFVNSKTTITIKDAGGNDVLYNLYIMTNSLAGNFTTTIEYKKGQ
jgi:hypothetical protein